MFIEVNRIAPDGLEIDRVLRLQPTGAADDPSVPEGVRLSGRFHRRRGDVVFRGRVEAVLSLLCSRCAAPMAIPLAGECYRVFRSGPIPKPVAEAEIDEEDLALTPYNGVRIDLTEIAREQVYLLVPLKPLCRESCAGICQHCGSNRNLDPCECTQDSQPGNPLTLKLPFNPFTN